jgi:hypothetical protein
MLMPQVFHYLVAVFSGVEGLARRLDYDCCGAYEANSEVGPHSRIDLDQKEMEEHLKSFDFEAAKAIYTLGGNSGAMAEIHINRVISGNPLMVKRGAQVKQGNVAVGILKTAQANPLGIKVSYTTSVCKEGGLAKKDSSGCFKAGSNISINGVDVGPAAAVLNTYRTLASFSTSASTDMRGQEFYSVYRAYYNEPDYAHQRVMAALEQKGVCSACDNPARIEIAKKTSAYMNVWMMVIERMEDAIIDCRNKCGPRDESLYCNDEPVHSWDVAFAFYAGSLDGVPDASGNKAGKLLHELADKRCNDFGTCKRNGNSAVNDAIVGEFRMGQYLLIKGRCSEAIPIKSRIVELMSVPLVQGSLRYAYKVHNSKSSSKEKAQGAAFSAAILPRIATCSPEVAKIISTNMDIASPSPMASGFTSVKAAFETVYNCLGITCKDVGGIVKQGDEYYASAEPCIDPPLIKEVVVPGPAAAPAPAKETGLPVWVLICVLVAALMVAALCAFAAWKRGHADGRRYEKFEFQHSVATGVHAETVGATDVRTIMSVTPPLEDRKEMP